MANARSATVRSVLEPLDIIVMLVVGIVAGSLGGMLGIGGSVIMIPAMAIIFMDRSWHSQHLYQAAAMIVNLVVAVPAAVKHHRMGNIRGDLFRLMLPVTLVAMVCGVLVSNAFSTPQLKRLFALFLAYVVVDTLLGLARRRPDHPPDRAIVTPVRAGTVGTAMGFLGGLLGIGGGAVAVPLAYKLCRVPFRQAIGASVAVMGITSAVGATIKVATLPQHNAQPGHAIVLALLLAPTAVLGGYLGAGLTGKLPINWIKLVFAIVLGLSGLRMAGVF